MSSETSTKELPPKGGSHGGGSHGGGSHGGGSHGGGSHGGAIRQAAGSFRLQAEDDGFHVSHFFVLLSLLGATVAVLMARPSAPSNLILISLTIGAAGLSAFGIYRILAPLVAPKSDFDRQPLSERMRLDLEREKALTLRSIKELEFDRAMGKVSPQDFEDMAARLRARALGIMRQLDEGSHAYRALIEKELARRVRKAPEVELPPKGGSHAGGSDTGGSHAGGSHGTCTCGTKNDADARFCKNCGSKLVAA